MRVRLFAAALAAGLGSASVAQTPATPPPKLVIAISVDQFSADLFDEYRPLYTSGLARLARGTVFHNGYQGHAATETCPGHSTILTGDRPARTGIIANTWYDMTIVRPDKLVYCAEDERVPGSSPSHYTVSPAHLRVPTLGEIMKRRIRGSRSVAISGKDRAAVMMGGHTLDQRWYWTSKGVFVTDLKGVAVPQTIAKANSAIAAEVATAQEPLVAPATCEAKAQVVPVEGGGKPVGSGRFARAAGDLTGFRASPELDGATLAIAASLIQEMKLGQGSAPDLLAISLSATDYVGHTYGTEGEEMCLQMFSLDRDLGDFFRVLDRAGIDYSVVLTADHGGLDIPERLREHGVPGAARVDPNLSASVIGGKVAAKLGIKGPVLIGDFGGDVYLRPELSAAERPRVVKEALALYRASPEVEAAFSAAEIQRTPSPTSTPDRWSLIERARASYYPGRSGDIVVILKSHIMPIVDTHGYVATHGSAWDYDRRVPILFWRAGMRTAEREQAVETADIMPTLAAMIGLPIDSGSIDGKCLFGIEGIPCPPR